MQISIPGTQRPVRTLHPLTPVSQVLHRALPKTPCGADTFSYLCTLPAAPLGTTLPSGVLIHRPLLQLWGSGPGRQQSLFLSRALPTSGTCSRWLMAPKCKEGKVRSRTPSGEQSLRLCEPRDRSRRLQHGQLSAGSVVVGYTKGGFKLRTSPLRCEPGKLQHREG